VFVLRVCVKGLINVLTGGSIASQVCVVIRSQSLKLSCLSVEVSVK
jgi:hypothetical protein